MENFHYFSIIFIVFGGRAYSSPLPPPPPNNYKELKFHLFMKQMYSESWLLCIFIYFIVPWYESVYLSYIKIMLLSLIA